MRLWSEERRLGTLELLLTMPITTWQAILAKGAEKARAVAAETLSQAYDKVGFLPPAPPIRPATGGDRG